MELLRKDPGTRFLDTDLTQFAEKLTLAVFLNVYPRKYVLS